MNGESVVLRDRLQAIDVSSAWGRADRPAAGGPHDTRSVRDETPANPADASLMRQVLTDAGPTASLSGPPSFVLVPPSVASVGVVRAALRVALEEQQWESDPTFRVLLATTEAVVNAVEHGSAQGELIEVTYQVGDVHCFVRVLDGGGPKPWTPPDLPVAPPEDDAERGRGLILIASLTQHMELRQARSGAEVRMNFTRDV